MKLIKEAIGIKNDEWVLFNDVLDELSTSSKNKELINRFSTFVKTTLDKDSERKQKSWERIKKKRENNPNYARPKSKLKENRMKVLKEENRKLNEGFRGCKEVEMIWHGAYSDPELYYKDEDGNEYYANYYDVEDSMWDYYKGEAEYAKTRDDDYAKEINSKYDWSSLAGKDDTDFDKFVVDHEDSVIGDVIEFSEYNNYNHSENVEESCKSKKKSKKLNETWKGEDVIADLVDRAQSLIDDGNYGDVDDCIRQAIDDGLIYSRDIWDLAEHYGVVDDSELIERYYEELFNDIYSQVEEREEDDEEEIEESKKLDESITVEIDEDEALEMLMNRLTRWTQDPIAEELYEQMYQSYIDGGVFDGGKFDVMQIVDNDWVNYCEVVEPGDDEHHYDELLKLYEEQGLGDVSTEDVGVSYIEAATERDGKVYFLCRW